MFSVVTLVLSQVVVTVMHLWSSVACRGGGLSELRCCGVSRVDECSGSGGLIVKHNRYAAMGCGVGVRRVSR